MNALSTLQKSTVATLGALAAAPAFAQVPVAYETPTLEARTSFSNGFNFPRRGAINEISLNDSGVIGLRGSETGPGYYASAEEVLWYGQVGAGGSPYRNLNTDPGTTFTFGNLTPGGTQFNFQRGGNTAAPEGFYAYDGSTYSLVTTQKGTTGAFDVRSPTFSSTLNRIGFLNGQGADSLVSVDPAADTATTYYDFAANGFTGSSGVSFTNDLVAAATAFGTGNSKTILSITPDGTATTVVTEGTVYTSLSNSTSQNNLGDIVFTGRLASGADQLAVWDRSTGVITPLVTEGVPVGVSGTTIDDIRSFAGQINDDGVVAFLGGQTLYVTDGTDLTRVVGPGDAILADAAIGATTVRQALGTFEFNNDETVVARLDLASGGNNAVYSFVAVVPEPASLALLALGGTGLLLRRRPA